MEQIKNLSPEELMKLLETKQEESVEIQHLQEDDLSSFLSFYSIAPGSDELPYTQLFKLYKNYSKEPMTSTQLKNQLNKTFTIANRNILINQPKLTINTFLLEALNKKEINPIKSKRVRIRLEDFLNHHKIENGDNWVKGKELFALFKSYSTTKISKNRFYKLLQLYITTTEIINHERHFRITSYEKTTKEAPK